MHSAASVKKAIKGSKHPDSEPHGWLALGSYVVISLDAREICSSRFGGTGNVELLSSIETKKYIGVIHVSSCVRFNLPNTYPAACRILNGLKIILILSSSTAFSS